MFAKRRPQAPSENLCIRAYLSQLVYNRQLAPDPPLDIFVPDVREQLHINVIATLTTIPFIIRLRMLRGGAGRGLPGGGEGGDECTSLVTRISTICLPIKKNCIPHPHPTFAPSAEEEVGTATQTTRLSFNSTSETRQKHVKKKTAIHVHRFLTHDNQSVY